MKIGLRWTDPVLKTCIEMLKLRFLALGAKISSTMILFSPGTIMTIDDTFRSRTSELLLCYWFDFNDLFK